MVCITAFSTLSRLSPIEVSKVFINPAASSGFFSSRNRILYTVALMICGEFLSFFACERIVSSSFRADSGNCFATNSSTFFQRASIDIDLDF